MEKTQAEKLAFTLNYLVEKGCIPGLLPRDVQRAAELLIEQERELALARTALAAKNHTVEAAISEPSPYRKRIAATFIIADPRIYRGEIEIDELQQEPGDYILHVARTLTASATADWIREMQERAYIAIRAASPAKRGTPIPNLRIPTSEGE